MISRNEDKRREKGTHNNDIAGGVVVPDGAEGPKGRPEGGEWEPIKISCNRKDQLDPKCTPNSLSPR